MKFKHKIFLSFFISGVALTIGGVVLQYYTSANLVRAEIDDNLLLSVNSKAVILESFLEDRAKNVGILFSAPQFNEQFKKGVILYDQIVASNLSKEIAAEVLNIDEYLENRNSLSAYDLLSDSEFQSIAVRNIGGLGYTSVVESENLITVASNNLEMMNKDIKKKVNASAKLSSIISRAQNGQKSFGIYKAADGVEKMVYAFPITEKVAGGLSLIVLWETDLSNIAPYENVTLDTAEYAENFASRYAYQEAFFLTPAGSVFWVSKESDKLNSNYLTDEKLRDGVVGQALEKSRQQKTTVISGLETVEQGAEAFFYTITPVIDKEQIIGYVGLQFYGEDIFNIVMRNDSNKTTIKSFLADDKSTIISPVYLKDSKILNQRISDLAISECFDKEAVRGQSVVKEYFDFRGETVVGAYHPIKNNNWCVISEIDKAEAFVPSMKLLLTGVLISVVIIIFVLFLGLFFGRVIARPLEVLTKEVEGVESGNLDFKINFNSSNEIGDLEKAFQKMVFRVKQFRSEAEKKVENQTEEILNQKNILEQQQKAVLNILDDINEEKEKLSQEKDKINTILLSIGDGVFVVDKDKKIIVFNQVAEEISGYSYSEVAGQSYNKILRFIFEKDEKENTKFVDDAFSKGKIQTMTNHTLLIRKDGIRVPVADSAAPLKDSAGNIIGCVVVFRDVTKEREVDKMKSEFISVASHQLKTPITGIRWFAEFLLKGDAGPLNKDQLDFVQQINDSNSRMIVLVNDLLNVSRIETGRKFTIEREPTDFVKLVREVIKENIALSSKKKVKVSMLNGAKIKCVMNVDAQKMWQVFNNLISNAIKYSRENGQVKIGCVGLNSEGSERIFFVEDNGIGIPKIQQKRVFERFFRADNAVSAQTDGTGLGLYIARAIVEAHGGKMWFESREGKGSKFYFSLPLDKFVPKSKKVKGKKILS